MPDTGDLPVSDPQHDLLAMAGAAQRLARRVARATLPFTLGIYGAWGEGKTTFAKLVGYYLRQQDGWRDQRFIEFSAWPFVTADAVWRALLETVARSVYGVQVEQDGEPLRHQPLPARLRSLLLTEIFPATTEPNDAVANEEAFEELVAKLGRARAITNRGAGDAESARQLAVMAGVMLDVATAATPLGALRSLLGRGEDAAGTAAGPPDRSLATVEEVRESVRHLFRAASTPRTVVLIDDLDRCLPEVAFDVLETIKVFLSESAETDASCLFIVAVDQAVLNRALSTRLGGETSAHSVDARMYLEKVIQLGVSVSDVRASTPDRLIAGRFPEWVGAGDLIDLATRGNPRRLKQQCDLLSFGFETIEGEP